jgi:hypothetical protein
MKTIVASRTVAMAVMAEARMMDLEHEAHTSFVSLKECALLCVRQGGLSCVTDPAIIIDPIKVLPASY